MRTNSVFIAHVAEAIGSPLGGGRGRRSFREPGKPSQASTATDQGQNPRSRDYRSS
jgi:hypothetical protein